MKARFLLICFHYLLIEIGTDHPFFPPLDAGESEWLSVRLNSQAVKSAFGDNSTTAEAIMGGNAMRVLHLGK